MDPLNKFIYKIQEKIPKRVKEDFTYLVNFTSTAALYAIAAVAAAIFAGYLFKAGCCERDNKAESGLESSINNSVEKNLR